MKKNNNKSNSNNVQTHQIKKDNRNNKLIITLMVIIILLVSITIFILNYSFNNTSLTILEKKWLTDNSTNMLDVSTYNNIPIFGKDGEGIIFDFLEGFTNEYNITFNKISYMTNSNSSYQNIAFKVINGEEELSANDILMYTDYYGLISQNYHNYSNPKEITNLNIGILKNDSERVKYYLGKDANTYTDYENTNKMIQDLKDKKIDYIILPINGYIDIITTNNFFIDYKFTGFNNKYILTVKDDALCSVMNKYYSNYLTKQYDLDYSKELLNTYFNAVNISDSEKVDYNNKTYTFGYINDYPFIGLDSNHLDGIISEYLNTFENIANIEFDYQKFDNINDLIRAINGNSIDISYASYNPNNIKIKNSTINIPSNRHYVILSKKYLNIDSIKGLKGYNNVYTIADSYLDSLAKEYEITTKSYPDSDELLRNVDDDSIILIDFITYEYYKDRKLNDYKIIYDQTFYDDYSFIASDKKENNVFNGLFKTYVSLKDFNNSKEEFIVNSSNISIEQIKSIAKYLLILFSIIFIFLLLCLIIINKKKKANLIKYNDKLKYIDLMTSLKNRNYLNNNIKKWSSNHRYPQAVIVVDLNNIKYINDNYGHEEGDNIIKKGANILIVNQLENSDIMRTDGNEFLIYLLGYDEKQIISYCHKLFKELKELPYNFGATLGHSMIEDDVKTIEDAINEATIEMRKAKEKMRG